MLPKHRILVLPSVAIRQSAATSMCLFVDFIKFFINYRKQKEHACYERQKAGSSHYLHFILQ